MLFGLTLIRETMINKAKLIKPAKVTLIVLQALSGIVIAANLWYLFMCILDVYKALTALVTPVDFPDWTNTIMLFVSILVTVIVATPTVLVKRFLDGVQEHK